MFDPKTDKFPYPDETDGHYLKVKRDRKIVFDSNYPYVDKSAWFRFVTFWVRLLLVCIVIPAAKVRMGLKINGKENLKKHREIIDKGIISCCNHVHMWDYISIMGAILPTKPYVLIWADNINGSLGPVMRHVGGIPIPENDRRATFTYLKAVRELLSEGNWLHIYPEGSMWEYYRPVRPFKKGAAYLACDSEKPILPLAYTYREPSFIRKHIFRQKACFTLNIGEPIFANAKLSKKEQIADLTKRCHEAVCSLAKLSEKENLYPPVFDEKQKRIDYYTSTYGLGYKGSW